MTTTNLQPSIRQRAPLCSTSIQSSPDASVITNVLVEVVDTGGQSCVGPIVLDHNPGASILFRRATPFYQCVSDTGFWVTIHLATGNVHGRAVGLWQSSPRPTWFASKERA